MIFLKQLAQIVNVKHNNSRLVDFMKILYIKYVHITYRIDDTCNT